MQSWFGVTPQQAVDSGYRPYSAGAGLKSAGFGITMVYFVNKHWFVSADGALRRLLGSAAQSPIVQSKTNGVCDISINYQF
jgi:outer membrane scaffolding protein for murein synthesis (MipA/OmpV family)